MALVGATAADARDVMVEGESGLLNVCPPWNKPRYEPSKRRVTWPNGALATLYSADEPDRLRGPQHDGALCDELAAWRYDDAWDQLMFGLRLGQRPRVVVATTPRPTSLIKRLLKAPTTAVTRGTSYDNRANLAPTFFAQIVAKYEGTRLGRQELNAELLEDVEGALWQRASMIDAHRVEVAPQLRRIVVGVDPSVADGGERDEAGIVVCGMSLDGQGYVLADHSLSASPDGWAKAAVAAYRTHSADRIVAEVNNGGAMVEATIRTVERGVSYKALHASRGKQTRAEPIAALYEQGRIHHVGAFPSLEDQMCGWVPGDSSPDRMDALVWALTELMLGTTPDAPAIGPERDDWGAFKVY